MGRDICNDKSGKPACLVTFEVISSNFKSNYQRNKFYRGLYGWTQIVKKNGKKYEYKRDGLLDEVPHIKVDKSVFILPIHSVEKIKKYLESWGEAVDYDLFKVLLGSDKFKKIKQKENKKEWIDVPIR